MPGQDDSLEKETNAGDSRDARPGRLSGEGNGNPLQGSCLGDPMDRGAWWATVRGVAKSCTRLSNEHFLSAGHTNHFQQGLTHTCCVVIADVAGLLPGESGVPAYTLPRHNKEIKEYFENTFSSWLAFRLGNSHGSKKICAPT